MKKRIKRPQGAHKTKSKPKLFLLLLLAFAGLFVFWAIKHRKYYSPDDKLSVAVQKDDGSVSVLIFDNPRGEIIEIKIPGNTEVEAGRNLGRYRLMKIWELGQNQHIGGGYLLTETLTSSLGFPTYVWASGEALNLNSGSPLNCIKGALAVYKTNLVFGDKLALANFCIRAKNIDRIEIDLSKSTFLKERRLADGETGYILTNTASPKLYSNFSSVLISSGDYKISVVDASDSPQIAKRVGEIMEILGGKVSSISKSEQIDINCVVKARKTEVVKIVAFVFKCKEEKDENFDPNQIEIKLGNRFSLLR